MSHSTSRPYGKWYESMFRWWRWDAEDLFLMEQERAVDEQERLRAADMMASRCLESLMPELQVCILPPIEGFSSWDIMKLRHKRRDAFEKLLKEFWRERV